MGSSICRHNTWVLSCSFILNFLKRKSLHLIVFCSLSEDVHVIWTLLSYTQTKKIRPIFMVLYRAILLTGHRCIISRLVHKIFLPSVDFRYLP